MGNRLYRLGVFTAYTATLLSAHSCSSPEFKTDPQKLKQSKNVVGTPSPASPGSPQSLMAASILHVRPDTKQKMRVGDVVNYQAVVMQSDGLSSEIDVTDRVTWSITEGSQSISPQGIANQTYTVKGLNTGAYKIKAELALGGDAPLESNIVEGEVTAESTLNQTCAYGPWVDGPCSKVCGGGTMTSTRTITVQPPLLLCEDTSKTSSCNTETCPQAAQPVQCKIIADKTEVELGKSVVATIEQTPDDPDSIFEIKAGDQVVKNKSITFSPVISGKITATVTNAGGVATCTPVDITVKQPEIIPTPSCNLVADKIRLPFGGGDVTITVQRTNVAPIESYYIDGKEGVTQKIKINQTTTFRGSASNASGSSACTPVTVDVLPPPPPPPTCSLIVDKSSLPAGGGDVNLKVQINGAAEKVWIDDLEASERSLKVTTSRLIEAKVQNQSGSNTCNIAITVAPPVTTPLNCTLTVTPSTLSSGGGLVKASLSISGSYNSANINGTVGTTLSENISATKSYLGKVTDESGNSASCSAVATVSPPQYTAPSCTLSADKIKLPAGGGAVTLKLNVNGTAEATSIDGSAGSTLTRTVSASKQFTASVSNPGGSSSCSIYIEVQPGAFCVHGQGGRVIFISTSEADANKCRDDANRSPFASPGGIDCSGDPAASVATSRCDSLAPHAMWKHRAVTNAGKCVRFNPLKCYQTAQFYKLP